MSVDKRLWESCGAGIMNMNSLSCHSTVGLIKLSYAQAFM